MFKGIMKVIAFFTLCVGVAILAVWLIVVVPAKFFYDTFCADLPGGWFPAILLTILFWVVLFVAGKGTKKVSDYHGWFNR